MLSTFVATLWLFGPACVLCSLDQEEEEDAHSVVLLQRELRHLPVFASIPPNNLAGADEMIERARQMLNNADPWIKGGFWANQMNLTTGCGKASFHELGMTIPEWRNQHPTEDGFCYFNNYAFWFSGSGEQHDEYDSIGRAGNSGSRVSTPLCGSLYMGADKGPEWLLHFDTRVIQEDHLDSCIDAMDDPYCYSLGWLKGQRLDQTNILNGTEWRAKAVSECERIQETFHFIDEEVTVGAHVFGTPVYIGKSVANALGRGPPVEDRMYNMHAYTKCQLGFGGAPVEMAYCYHKGCVLSNGKIAHGPECGY